MKSHFIGGTKNVTNEEKAKEKRKNEIMSCNKILRESKLLLKALRELSNEVTILENISQEKIGEVLNEKMNFLDQISGLEKQIKNNNFGYFEECYSDMQRKKVVLDRTNGDLNKLEMKLAKKKKEYEKQEKLLFPLITKLENFKQFYKTSAPNKNDNILSGELKKKIEKDLYNLDEETRKEDEKSDEAGPVKTILNLDEDIINDIDILLYGVKNLYIECGQEGFKDTGELRRLEVIKYVKELGAIVSEINKARSGKELTI